MSAQDGQKPRKSRVFLLIYSLALFSAAAIIVLLSYFYSSRMNQSAEELEKSQQLSLSALQSVDKLIENNRILNEQLEEYELQLEKANLNAANIQRELYDTHSELTETRRELRETTAKLEALTKLYNELLTQGEETDD